MHNGVEETLGRFSDVHEAARTYDSRARQLGWGAERLNFPLGIKQPGVSVSKRGGSSASNAIKRPGALPSKADFIIKHKKQGLPLQPPPLPGHAQMWRRAMVERLGW